MELWNYIHTYVTNSWRYIELGISEKKTGPEGFSGLVSPASRFHFQVQMLASKDTCAQ